jgi:prepilin-type N-terminal cleavage/methylation domain-containing protein
MRRLPEISLYKTTVKGKRAFTLVEIMIVVVIIGMLAMLAIPAFRKSRLRSKYASFASEARVFAEASQVYTLETGRFPSDTSSGALPDFSDYIRDGTWLRPTPIGGVWDVEHNGMAGIALMVGVDGHDLSGTELADLDDFIDNGDLDSGKYRRFGDRYYYVVED